MGAIDDAIAGAKLVHLMPLIEEEVSKMDKALTNRIFQAIMDGTLTPEVAYNAWLEKHSYEKLLKKFQVKVRLGVSACEKSAGELTGP